MYLILVVAALVCTCLTRFQEVDCTKSRGDFCLGSTGITANHNDEDCDNYLTNLICYEGKCACPEALTMSSANLPRNLNTWWHREKKKCFAIRGAMCDTTNKVNKITCLPGNTCTPNKTNKNIATCV